MLIFSVIKMFSTCFIAGLERGPKPEPRAGAAQFLYPGPEPEPQHNDSALQTLKYVVLSEKCKNVRQFAIDF
jgi:hypothetical protein